MNGYRVTRLPGNPIIHPGLSDTIGDNINGPSLIRVPAWVPDPLGRYYLYFAHHSGGHIRMAYADELSGPWRVHEPGVLSLEDSCFRRHVASPDVHVDESSRQIRMYFHGSVPPPQRAECERIAPDNPFPPTQFSRLAVSTNGLRFKVRPPLIAPTYLRVFRHGEWYYGVVKPCWIFRSADGETGWEAGPSFLDERVRHGAVRIAGDSLEFFFSRIGENPEHIRVVRFALHDDWLRWTHGPETSVIEPFHVWEGADCSAGSSEPGSASQRVRQLRDPGIFVEDGKTYLLYSVAGESGIAITQL